MRTYTLHHNLDCACYIDGSLKVDGSDCTSNDVCPCDANGLCTCGIGYTGEKCDKCETGYYDFDGNDLDGSASCTGKFILNKCIQILTQWFMAYY